MNTYAKQIDDAGMLLVNLERIRAAGGEGDTVHEQIDAIGKAVVGIVLYLAEQDGLKLTQP